MPQSLRRSARTALEILKKINGMTREQREGHFRRGMVRIYGGARCRRSRTADQAWKLRA